MKVLFVGGTGNISSAVTELLVSRGVELTVLSRGRSERPLPEGARSVRADIRQPETVAAALGDEAFDVVVDWLVYEPEHVETDIRLFRGRTGQYVFVSTAAAYLKPSPDFPIVETSPLGCPHWSYPQKKIACEERLREEEARNGFPVTIVRPSYTYGERWIPAVLAGQAYTLVDRMLRGKPVIVPGDGQTLWTMTHNTDFARGFAGILGRADAVGEAFHIMSDERLTWDQITNEIAAAAGTEARIVHIPSDFIAAVDAELGANMLGDKSHTAVFDTSKLKRFVPDFAAVVPLAEGVRRSIAWFDADPSRKVVDHERDEAMDGILDAYLACWPGGAGAAA